MSVTVNFKRFDRHELKLSTSVMSATGCNVFMLLVKLFGHSPLRKCIHMIRNMQCLCFLFPALPINVFCYFFFTSHWCYHVFFVHVINLPQVCSSVW